MEDEDVEYVAEPLELPDAVLQDFGGVFARFQAPAAEDADQDMVHLRDETT
jgi:hypothetical protein